MPKARRATIFLLGAGASVDAGMPTVQELTRELKAGLPRLRDVNGRPRPFGRLFATIERHDCEVGHSYERFFYWVSIVLEVARNPYRQVVRVRIAHDLMQAMGHLPFVVGDAVSRILASRRARPGYLARLSEFAPRHGRLKVFSLNYDRCVEQACRSSGTDLVTGFDRRNGLWNPSVFRSRAPGVNLYKLHGSLSWFGLQDKATSNGQINHHLRLVERSRRPRRGAPCLVLGPGPKVVAYDPFLTLLKEFHDAASSARICVLVGYGHRDDHVNEILSRAVDDGMVILDVNPTPTGRYLDSDRYHHLPLPAKEAFISGRLKTRLRELIA